MISTDKENEVIAANRNELMISTDNGATWNAIQLPLKLSSVQAVSTAPNGSLWVGGREGLFFSEDHGQSWKQLIRLPLADINGLNYNRQLGRLIVTSWRSTLILALDVDNKTWKWWDTGWTVRAVRSLGSRLVAASLYNGVIVQPGREQTTANVSASGGAQQ
jgi:ligand-binding sensor domain-containing protein